MFPSQYVVGSFILVGELCKYVSTYDPEISNILILNLGMQQKLITDESTHLENVKYDLTNHPVQDANSEVDTQRFLDNQPTIVR